MAHNPVSHKYLTEKLAPLAKSVNDILPVNGDVKITAFDVPYAYYTLDVTATPAPPALPRARSWRVDFVGPIMGSYNYRRYFYASAAEAQADDPLTAVAAWVIDERHMFFECLDGGAIVETFDLTDIDGNPLLRNFRPIAEDGAKWFFGPNHGTSAFPDADNARSIIDLDIDAINTIIGSSFDLSTNAKQLVYAINELYTLLHYHQQVLITDDETPQNLAGNPGDIAITPYGLYVMKFKVSTGFMATASDARFSGIWTDMGINEMHTTNGASSHFVDIQGDVRNTHWFLHESGNYVLVWSNYNANANTPRAGYWFINNANTPRLDTGALLSKETAVSPQLPTSLPTSGPWGPVTITWSNYTGSEPSDMDWVLHFKLNSGINGELFIGENQMAVVPMPPETGTFRLTSTDGVLKWVV